MIKKKLPKHRASGALFLLFYFFTFLLFYLFHAMHELTPSAVAIADRIEIAV